MMNMKTKKDIVEDWLPRYTGRALEDFSKHIILTNFDYYLELFAEKFNAPIIGEDKNMPNVSHDGITMINFGMGSANAATVLDLLSAIEPEAVLFIGKCGGLKAFPLPPSKEREHPTTTCPKKSLPYPLSASRKPVQKSSRTMTGNTTRESCTPPTDEYGNSTRISKNT